jgi:hypothetical protein
MGLPGNSAVAENILPRLREIITSGHLPPMLPAGSPMPGGQNGLLHPSMGVGSQPHGNQHFAGET